MRWFLTLLAWVVATAVLAPLCFFAVWFLAGPHSSLLPPWAQSATLIAGWLVLLAGPVLMARGVWRRLAPRGH